MQPEELIRHLPSMRPYFIICPIPPGCSSESGARDFRERVEWGKAVEYQKEFNYCIYSYDSKDQMRRRQRRNGIDEGMR